MCIRSRLIYIYIYIYLLVLKVYEYWDGRLKVNKKEMFD